MVVYPTKQAQPSSASQKHEGKRNHNSDEEGIYHEKDLIEVNLSALTWKAYDAEGKMVRSGPVSGGKEYCSDLGRECRTIEGTFTIYHKGDENCKSSRFPLGKGGAPMPYCMYFHGGYALHGSNFVPNYNASHGCVRMSFEDAQWLNEDFVQVGSTRVDLHY
ncbi:MAG: L,D-transpeptidase [Proteobacteria bacterium]|nr:L,D-transpeptidase [Pseudomonadota bacterium]